MGLTSLQVCMDMDSASDDQHHRWALQATTMHEDALMDSSASPSEGDMLGPSQILMSERRLRPPQDQALKCPRCDSTHTKFCYYNNYSLSQPRYFCKTCRRYWTKGGTLRNIPVGGGFRKNRKSSSSSSSSSSSKKALHSTEQQQQPLSMNSAQLINNQNPNPLMMMMSLPNQVDLQLSFQTDNNNNGYPFSLPSSNMIITSGSGNGNNSGGDGYSESMHYNHNNIASLESSRPRGGLIRPIDYFCLDHKQVEALVMNNTSKSNNNHDGYSFNSSQFVAGGGSSIYASNNNHLAGSSIYSNVQNLAGYAHDIGLSYIDGNISASHQSLEYSGLHEHHDIPFMDREVKPNTKMLALEWQQEGFSDARCSKDDTFECLGSWSGMSSAGNYHQHHHQQQQQQLLLPSATTNSSVL